MRARHPSKYNRKVSRPRSVQYSSPASRWAAAMSNRRCRTGNMTKRLKVSAACSSWPWRCASSSAASSPCRPASGSARNSAAAMLLRAYASASVSPSARASSSARCAPCHRFGFVLDDHSALRDVGVGHRELVAGGQPFEQFNRLEHEWLCLGSTAGEEQQKRKNP